jgi:hypothetical protein
VPSHPDLDQLKASLLRDLGVQLQPEQGDVAFERHQLLAIRFHRAARLNGRAGEGEGGTWVRYFGEHFPRGVEHADLLWAMHWQMTSNGLLYLHLESLWVDYVTSVENFVAMLDADAARRKVALERWRKLQWSVEMVTVPTGLPVALPTPLGYTASAASVSASSSTLKRH